MYMETTHGNYGGVGPLADLLGVSRSILPMNINVTFWGETFGSRSDLANPRNNIRAGARILRGIISNFRSPASVAAIATLYNDLGATSVNDYGARAQVIYNSRIWERQK